MAGKLTAEEISMIKEAFSYRIARPVITKDKFYICPRCGSFRSIVQKHDFCHDCGQHLDWSQYYKEKEKERN